MCGMYIPPQTCISLGKLGCWWVFPLVSVKQSQGHMSSLVDPGTSLVLCFLQKLLTQHFEKHTLFSLS